MEKVEKERVGSGMKGDSQGAPHATTFSDNEDGDNNFLNIYDTDPPYIYIYIYIIFVVGKEKKRREK